jgi:dihydroxyacetone kinase-like protein
MGDLMTVSVSQLIDWMTRFDVLVEEHRTELTDLDSAIGDGDHGTNMARGWNAVVEKLNSEKPEYADDFGKLVGMTLISSVGGASGPLFGTFFLRLGSTAGHEQKVAVEHFAHALEAGLDGVIERGKAELADKTMVDALEPAVRAFRTGLAVGDLAYAARLASEAAQAGRDATRDELAHKGRASYLGERSLGHIDPGAASTALLFQALAEALA